MGPGTNFGQVGRRQGACWGRKPDAKKIMGGGPGKGGGVGLRKGITSGGKIESRRYEGLS